MTKSEKFKRIDEKMRDATLIDRLKWAARGLQICHETGDFTEVTDGLKLLGAAHSRFVVLEMALKFVPQPQPQELRNLHESLTHDAYMAPFSRRASYKIREWAEFYLCSFED